MQFWPWPTNRAKVDTHDMSNIYFHSYSKLYFIWRTKVEKLVRRRTNNLSWTPLSPFWTPPCLSSPTTPLLHHEGLIISQQLSSQFLRQMSKCQGDAKSWQGNGLWGSSLGWLTGSFIHPIGGVVSCEPIIRNFNCSQGRTSPSPSLSSGLLTLKVRLLVLL